MAENESERMEKAAPATEEAAEAAPKAEAAPRTEAASKAETGGQDKPKKGWKREVFEWVMVFVVAGVIAFVVRTFLFVPVMVDGESMLNTLQDHEYLIATKYDYLLGDPERFDVVICHYPGRMRAGLLGIGQMQEDFVKRVVGLPGETIELRDGVLYVDGEYVAQDMLQHLSLDNLGPVTLAPGYYFVLGDNRPNSLDSRHVGPIARDAILGRVRQVFFPLSAIRSVEYTPGL